MLLNNEIITLENIKLIKDSAAPVIMMNNTKGQDPEIIKRIPKNIDVKVLGGYNFCEDVKYLKPKYVESRIDKFDFNEKHYEEDVDFYNNLHIDTDINMKNGDCINVTLKKVKI